MLGEDLIVEFCNAGPGWPLWRSFRGEQHLVEILDIRFGQVGSDQFQYRTRLQSRLDYAIIDKGYLYSPSGKSVKNPFLSSDCPGSACVRVASCAGPIVIVEVSAVRRQRTFFIRHPATALPARIKEVPERRGDGAIGEVATGCD
jgi:hypothetical protein